MRLITLACFNQLRVHSQCDETQANLSQPTSSFCAGPSLDGHAAYTAIYSEPYYVVLG